MFICIFVIKQSSKQKAGAVRGEKKKHYVQSHVAMNEQMNEKYPKIKIEHEPEGGKHKRSSVYVKKIPTENMAGILNQKTCSF